MMLSKNNFHDSSDYQPLVLIVDNDRDNLLFASCVIESIGINYAVLDDSEECFNLVCKLLPDIILLDIVMPKVSGFEIIRQIRQTENIAKIPIIAVTGLTKSEEKDKLLEEGFDDYICKPYLIEELEAKIYSYIGYKQEK